MPRIRTIKPEFFRHMNLFRAEKETGLPLRLAYISLWTAADRDGRFKWDPEQLKVDCLPIDDLDFSRVLHALLTRGFLHQYGPSLEYGCIPSWKTHQFVNGKEKDSSIPLITKEEIDACLSRALRVVDACLTDGVKEGKGREGKGTQEKIKIINPSSPDGEGLGPSNLKRSKPKTTQTYTTDFETFWTAYPRRVGKVDACKAWQKILPDADTQEVILKSIMAYKTTKEWLKDGGQFIPHPSTWLNARRWEDELEVKITPPEKRSKTWLCECGREMSVASSWCFKCGEPRKSFDTTAA